MQNVNLLRMCLLVQIRGDISTVMRRWLASSVNTAASYWITPYTGVTSFASKKVYLRPVKRRSWRCTHFVTKRRSTLFFLQQLGTWLAARQAWFVGGKPSFSRPESLLAGYFDSSVWRAKKRLRGRLYTNEIVTSTSSDTLIQPNPNDDTSWGTVTATRL